MSAVTPQMVKELREMTGAGMSDCKKALDQAAGNMDKAVEVLRERGLAAAAKKAGRAAAEGMVNAFIAPGNNMGFIVEINCETDFVTRNDEFQNLVSEVTKTVLTQKPTNLDELLALPFQGGASLKDTIPALVAKIGENIAVRRMEKLGGHTQSVVASYVHGQGKVGVLVELTGENVDKFAQNPELLEAGKDVALQVAAMKPQFTDRTEISPVVLEKESQLFYQQYKAQGKPEAALPKIVSSRIETWFKEICLQEQLFVKDDTKSVQNFLAETGKKLGITGLKVKSFLRLELGEGVEKRSDDFATEVAAQIAEATKK
jgi:elongation factor Ts